MAYLDFTSALYYMDLYGLTDLILPFILLFSISFAILQQTGILKERKYNAIVSFAISLMVVIPHVTGNYPGGYDVVQIINSFLPSAVLVIVSIFIFLVLVSVVSDNKTVGSSAIVGLVSFIAVIALVLVFVGSLTPNLSGWFSTIIGPGTQSVLLVLLVAGLVIYFITKEDKKPSSDTAGKKMKDFFSGLFGPDSD